MEKYSVLMSLYWKERPEYLRSALDSMVSQTVLPDEIVLVEDGPLTEELYAVVKEYREKNPGLFHPVVNEKNLGLGPALAAGLQECRNELVARMDTDDISLPDRCEKQLRAMEEDPGLAVVGGQIEEFVDETDRIVGKRVVPCTDEEIRAYLTKRCPFNHVAVMLRKSSVLEVGNYVECFWNEDYHLWVRLALSGARFANLPETLVKVRTGRDMYRRRGGRKYFQSEKQIQKMMLDHDLIGLPRYCVNVLERFVMQILLPSRIRGFVFRLLARKH